MHTNSRDEALGLPTQDAVQIALRTQQIVAHESGVTNSTDPLAGSYFIESLTDQIEEAVWEYLNKIEQLGGMVHAIEAGYIQKEIQDAAYKYQQEVESNERVVVGVNKYTVKEERDTEILKVDPALRKIQSDKLAELRKSRDNDLVKDCLTKLSNAAKDEKTNLMPSLINR